MNYCECSRPAGDGRYLCKTCAGELGRALGQVPGLIRELGTTAARLDQVKVGTPAESESVSSHAPDPVNWRATDCADELRRHVKEWTADDAEKIAKAIWGPRFMHKLDRLRAKAMRIIDREPERQHLGPCPTPDCGEPMNPVRGELEHHCKTCGETTVIADYQGDRLGKAWGVVARPPQLVPVLASLGVRISPQKLKDWARRGGLDVAAEIDGHPAYRVSDVYDVAMRVEARKKTVMKS